MRSFASVLVALVLLAPVAAAFPAAGDRVTIEYGPGQMPLVVAAGDLTLEGKFHGAFAGMSMTDSRFGPIPSLVVAQRDESGRFSNATIPGATVIVHAGGAFATFGDRTATGRLHAAYGGLVTFPSHDSQSSDSSKDGGGFSSPLGDSPVGERGFIVVADALEGTFTFGAGSVDLFAFNATISVLDAQGAPVAGFDHRAANAGAKPGDSDAKSSAVLLAATGPFEATYRAKTLIASPGQDADLSATVTPAAQDRFSSLVSSLKEAGAAFSDQKNGGGSGPGAGGSCGQACGNNTSCPPEGCQSCGPQGCANSSCGAQGCGGNQPGSCGASDCGSNGPREGQGSGGGGNPLGGGDGGGLPDLGPFAAILNGAVLIVNAPDGSGAKLEPLAATFGKDPLKSGVVSILRGGSLTVAWKGGTFSVQGEPRIAFTGQGFAVRAPLLAGPVPILAALLWLAAIGSLVWFIVKRPSKEKVAMKWRWMGRGAYLVAFVAAALVWDAGFRASFGTSAIALWRAGAAPVAIAGAFGVESALWSLAFILFGLPARIVLGVVLRQRVQKKGLAGFAQAGGVLVLLAFGWFYALWAVGELFALVTRYVPLPAFPGQ